MTQLNFRPAKATDLPFIFKSWLKNYRDSDFAKNIDQKTFYAVHHNVIEILLKRSTVVIAHPIGEPEVIAGFLVYESKTIPTIHYCYVKFPFRRMKVGSAMLNHANIDISKTAQITHREVRPHWLMQKFPALAYNPYAI